MFEAKFKNVALAFEKPENVITKFKILRNKIRNENNCDEVNKFVEYFNRKFVGCEKTSLFSVENWSTYYRILHDIPTTSNFAKSWNKGINYSIRNSHPSVNCVLKELRSRDFLNSDNIISDLRTGKIKTPNSKIVKFKKIIQDYDRYYDLAFLHIISEIKEE